MSSEIYLQLLAIDSDSIYFINKVTIWQTSSVTSIKAQKATYLLLLVPPEIVFNSLFIELGLSKLYASVD